MQEAQYHFVRSIVCDLQYRFARASVWRHALSVLRLASFENDYRQSYRLSKPPNAEIHLFLGA